MIILRFEQLIYLIDLQKTGSISQTADKNMISHQAVSKAIKSLEIELSVTLLERSSKGVSFTPAGQQVLLFASTVLQKKIELDKHLTLFRTEEKRSISGSLTIYAGPRYITHAFLDFLEKMHLIYPNLHLKLITITADHIFSDIIIDENTIVLFNSGYSFIENINPIPNKIKTFVQDNSLQYQILDKQPLYCCVHKKSKLNEYTTIPTQISNQYPCVAFTYIFEPVFNIKFTIDSFEQQKNIIKKGSCFGRVTKEEFKSFFSPQFSLIPFEDRPFILFMAIYQKKNNNPLIQLFLSQLKKTVIF